MIPQQTWDALIPFVCARAPSGNNQLEESQTTERDAAEKYPHDKNRETTREKANTIFNEVRQFAYVLGTREREILLIQQSITRGYQRDFQRDTIHKGSNP